MNMCFFKFIDFVFFYGVVMVFIDIIGVNFFVFILVDFKEMVL